MKVHVIRDSGFPVEQYEQVMKLLQATAGLISFIPQQKGIGVEELNSFPVSVNNTFMVDGSGHLVKRKIQKTDKLEWEYFFYQCNAYRLSCSLDEQDFIVLLTDKSNSNNFLSAFDDHSNCYFVKTNEWDYYLDCDPVFPTAFTIMSQLFMKLYFKTMNRRIKEGHKRAFGCISDMCFEKHEVIFKFRTADVCIDCLEKMQKAGVPPEYFIQAFSLFEKVRTEMLFKQRHKFEVAQRKIHISRSTGRSIGITIRFNDIDKEVRLNPKRSVLYLFFLNHPEGVVLAEMRNIKYRKELETLYGNFYNRTTKTKQKFITKQEEDDFYENLRQKNIESAINYFIGEDERQQGPSSDFTNIRNEFRKILGDTVGKDYYIDDLPNGEENEKCIRLDRRYVSYDKDIKEYILGEYQPKVDTVVE